MNFNINDFYYNINQILMFFYVKFYNVRLLSVILADE